MSAWLRAAFVLVLFAAGIFGWTRQCVGPEPAVKETRVQPPEQPGQPYVIEATIKNSGDGDGSVDIEARLIEKQTRKSYATNSSIYLHAGETVVVSLDVNAPEGDYDARVRAQYPQR